MDLNKMTKERFNSEEFTWVSPHFWRVQKWAVQSLLYYSNPETLEEWGKRMGKLMDQGE